MCHPESSFFLGSQWLTSPLLSVPSARNAHGFSTFETHPPAEHTGNPCKTSTLKAEAGRVRRLRLPWATIQDLALKTSQLSNQRITKQQQQNPEALYSPAQQSCFLPQRFHQHPMEQQHRGEEEWVSCCQHCHRLSYLPPACSQFLGITLCGSLNGNGSHRLMCLKAWP